jgi:alginate O-acetyltransferase complex protein AlgI
MTDDPQLTRTNNSPPTAYPDAYGAWPSHPRLAVAADIKSQAAGPGPQRETFPPFLTYATFVTFFPHLIAGPIVRPSEIIPQLAARDLGRPRLENFADGVLIFLLGLGKKLVLADMFGGFANVGFDAAARGANLTFFEAWYATLSYALQIYFDFSGYSDMAIGLARMMNIRFPLNFDSPYQATNIAEFWRRWHITLGGFLRDYLYIPLGGNRTGPIRETRNLLATMLLCGLWHGAAWNFVIWGGLHGLLIVIHKQYRRVFPPLPAPLAQALTLFVVILAWVPFRAASVSSTMSVLRAMAGLNGIDLPRMIVSALPGLASIANPVSVLPYLGDARTLSFPELSACLLLGWLIVLTLPNIHRMTRRTQHWSLTGSFALSMQALFFAPHVAPFLYFQF